MNTSLRAKPRLLIVDDEQGIVDELVSFFSEEGFEVSSSMDGEGGIALIKERNPHICILDLKLPDMSGLLVLKIAKESNPHVKVIVNTGYVDQHLVDQAKSLKCDVFLHKPFDLFELKQKIDGLLA